MTLLVRSFIGTSDVEGAAALGLVAVRGARVSALASATRGAPAASEPELRAHAEVTGRVHELVASLPARFGLAYEDQADLVRALEAREAELVAAIAAIGRRVEIALTMSWRTERAPMKTADGATGREYLAARAARERERREAEGIAARLVGELGYERAFTRESICPRDGVAATVALLVPREEVMGVRRQVASLRERMSEVVVAAYGPFAPYSFAS